MTKTIITIDVGKSGGIAWQIPGAKVAVEKMPDTERDTFELLDMIVRNEPLIDRPQRCVAFVENVPVGMAGKGAASSKLNFNAGLIRGILIGLNVRIELVRPQKWQQHFSLGKRADCATDTIWKNKLKAEAQRRFPGLTVTLATADALLLLEYAQNL